MEDSSSKETKAMNFAPDPSDSGDKFADQSKGVRIIPICLDDREIRFHRNLLKARSLYWKALLDYEMKKRLLIFSNSFHYEDRLDLFNVLYLRRQALLDPPPKWPTCESINVSRSKVSEQAASKEGIGHDEMDSSGEIEEKRESSEVEDRCGHDQGGCSVEKCSENSTEISSREVEDECPRGDNNGCQREETQECSETMAGECHGEDGEEFSGIADYEWVELPEENMDECPEKLANGYPTKDEEHIPGISKEECSGRENEECPETAMTNIEKDNEELPGIANYEWIELPGELIVEREEVKDESDEEWVKCPVYVDD